MADTLDDHHSPDTIIGCSVAGGVRDEEYCGRTFIHCGSDKVANACGLESSGVNRMVNDIG